MTEHDEQIRRLEKARGILLNERRVIVLGLDEASNFLAEVTKLVDHQEKIEAIDRVIQHEKAGTSNFSMHLRNV
jgi:hypothetical protein